MWQSQVLRNHGSERVLEKPNEPPLSEGHTSGSGEGSMEHIFELMDTVPPTPHDSPLTGGYIPGSDEEGCTSCGDPQTKEKSQEIRKKEEVKHLTPRSRIYRQVESSDDDLDEEDASKQGRESDKTKLMFQDSDFDVLDDDMEDVEGEIVHTATTGVSAVSAPVTTVGTLVKMRSDKAKVKGVAFRDVEETPRLTRSTTKLQPLPTIDLKDKGKGVLVEEEPEKPEKVKRRDQGLAQIEINAELAQSLHEEELVELDKAQKEKQKQEEATNAALTEEFDEIQARMDANHELAVRLTNEEQEKYTIKERARLLSEYFERRNKQLAAERKEAIRNKPPTRAQVRNMMVTYLKHMGKYTHQELKHKTLEELQKLYQKEQKIADSTSKKKSSKKSKVIKEQESATSNEEAATDYEQEKEELRMWLAVVLDEDETVDLKILSVKYPIVDWESQNLGSVDMEDIHVYKIIRADGNTSYHKTFSSMLKKFSRQDLMDFRRLVMKRFEDNPPEGYNLLLWGDLKVMFEPNAKDEIWIEKRYPLIKEMLKKMLNWKLEAEAKSTMAFELLKFIKSQFRGGLLGIMDFYHLVLLIQLDTAGDGCPHENDSGNQFDERIRSDPHRYMANFLEISNLFQYGENQEEAVMLRTFPFSLSGEAKIWLNELNEGTITRGLK
ncbi:hypothetical protein Tco_1047349 [Tanacetum coccineum]